GGEQDLLGERVRQSRAESGYYRGSSRVNVPRRGAGLERLDGEVAAVHDDRRAGDVARSVGGKEYDHVRDFARLADPSERIRPLDAVEEARRLFVVHTAEVALQHRRVDRSRRDRVDPDPVGSDLHGERTGRGDETGLRGRIRDAAGKRDVALNRGEEDDAAAAALAQRRDRGLRAEERALQVGVEDDVDRLLVLLLEV